MLNTVFSLVAPRRFEVEFNEIDLSEDHIVVRPTYLSICHADQRYYQGTRPTAIMKQKLPMALIHEGIGKVVYDPTGQCQTGQEVIMVPNTPVETDEYIAENYLKSSRFRASGFDGFMQEYVCLQPDRVVPLPEGIDPTIAAFTELVSVSVHAMKRFGQFSHGRRDRIGIWGDGNLGYLTAVICQAMYPESQLFIFGTDRDKLAGFSFAKDVFLVTDIPEDIVVDHAFECVGGQACGQAIEQIIDRICPEGTVSLLGVSEYPVPINTRMILEKGLRFFGSSRSGRKDFEDTVNLYQNHPEILDYLYNIVGAKVEVRTIQDMKNAFELDIHKHMGKTIMIWKQ